MNLHNVRCMLMATSPRVSERLPSVSEAEPSGPDGSWDGSGASSGTIPEWLLDTHGRGRRISLSASEEGLPEPPEKSPVRVAPPGSRGSQRRRSSDPDSFPPTGAPPGGSSLLPRWALLVLSHLFVALVVGLAVGLPLGLWRPDCPSAAAGLPPPLRPVTLPPPAARAAVALPVGRRAAALF